MKILQVNKLYFPWVGGMEKTVQDIAEGLSRKDNYNVEVLVCQPKGKGSEEALNGIKVYRAASLGMFLGMPISIQFVTLFCRLARGVDVVHVHHPFPLAVFAYLMCKPKAKLVVHYHSDIYRQKISYAIFKPFLRKFLKRSDAIIVTNPYIIENSEILKDYRKKCYIVPSGIRIEDFQLDDLIKDKIIEIKKQIGSPIVLFVGRLVYYKGVEYLIRAFKNINAQLVIVGSGPLENDLKQLVEDWEIEERVHFLNNIPDEDLKAFYHACDIFVLPSIEKTECFGLVQLEAMACGKAVISTNLPTGVPWINQHKKTGLVVPPKDAEALHQAIVFLLENERLRNEYGKNGQERVKEFTIDLMVEKINNLYLSLCKR